MPSGKGAESPTSALVDSTLSTLHLPRFPSGLIFPAYIQRSERTSPEKTSCWLLEVQAMPGRTTHKNVKEIFEEVQVGYHSVPFHHTRGEGSLALLNCQATINMEYTRTDRW